MEAVSLTRAPQVLAFLEYPSPLSSHSKRITARSFSPSPSTLSIRASSAPFTPSSQALLARGDLLSLISDQERGVLTQRSSIKRSEIVRAIEALAAFGIGSVTTDSSLSATWRMLWTTEKEQLFIIDKAHLFGTKAGDILQVIDVGGSRLNNVITFPPDGAFIVDSTITVVSGQRVNFRFTRASLHGRGWNVPFPPYGQGWFDSVYLDEKIRVAKDIRGDYLVVDRAPYNWEG